MIIRSYTGVSPCERYRYVSYTLCVCLTGFVVPWVNVSLIWRRHHYRWRTANSRRILYRATPAVSRFFREGGVAISSVSYRTEPISYRTEPITSPFATSKGYWGSNLARIPTDYIYIQSICICNNILQVCNLYTPFVHVISER